MKLMMIGWAITALLLVSALWWVRHLKIALRRERLIRQEAEHALDQTSEKIQKRLESALRHAATSADGGYHPALPPMQTVPESPTNHETVPAPLKASTIERLREEMGTQFVPLAYMFIDHFPQRKSALEQAHQAGDGESLARRAHKLKGSSAYIGAERLMAICYALEQAAKTAQWDQVPDLLIQLQKEGERALEALTHYAQG
ncbi:MAG: Hpt domain-containing protein [Magnetococcales bacterium]|nr:Hpt domain-containing protein [Magnetococcales bacterium]